MFVDSHAHLSSDELYPLKEDLIERAKAAGIEAIVNICTEPGELDKGIALHQAHPWIYTAGSTTPHDVARFGEEHFPAFVKAAKAGQLVAIGETGLDYHYQHSPVELQKKFLVHYLELALECNLPVIIHCRDAFSDLVQILDAHYPSNRGVLHCFTGTLAEAKEVIKRGWQLSLSGIVTFKKSEALREVAAYVPLEQLLIETDAPYLAPGKMRGKQNEPAYLPETAHVIAECKGLPLEQLAAATAKNAKQLFQL